jgi:hypothetical protein
MCLVNVQHANFDRTNVSRKLLTSSLSRDRSIYIDGSVGIDVSVWMSSVSPRAKNFKRI